LSRNQHASKRGDNFTILMKNTQIFLWTFYGG